MVFFTPCNFMMFLVYILNFCTGSFCASSFYLFFLAKFGMNIMHVVYTIFHSKFYQTIGIYSDKPNSEKRSIGKGRSTDD